MPLKMTDFRIQKIVLELRYPHAFALWDHAGSIVLGLQESFPKLKLEEAAPNQQRFTLDHALTAEIKIDRAVIATTYPESNLEKIRSAADAFYGRLLSGLKQTELQRIGLRVFFEKTFESRDDAAKYVATVSPTLEKQGKFFNIEGGRLLDGEIFYRWEGDTLGCAVRVLTQEQNLEITAPTEFPDISSISSKKTMVLIDVDYYAHSVTPVAKFRASALIESWSKLLRRDLEAFLNV